MEDRGQELTMTDRDTFAAAALAGILANEGEGSNISGTCQWAYRIADAMLRERTNHGAVPAAKAAPSESSVPLGKGHGTGNSVEPVAWAVVYPNDEVAVIAFKRRDADERASASDRIVPLYRHPQPTLTDEEREAIKAAERDYADNDMDAGCWQIAATLRGLLERMK